MTTLHATCVAISEQGVLICGASGAGKSDLAIRLIDAGATLVADDQVGIRTSDGHAYASAPGNLRGLIEVRGVGICEIPFTPECEIALVVELSNDHRVERLPEPYFADIAGIPVKALKLNAFESSTPAKIQIGLNAKIMASGEILKTDN